MLLLELVLLLLLLLLLVVVLLLLPSMLAMPLVPLAFQTHFLSCISTQLRLKTRKAHVASSPAITASSKSWYIYIERGREKKKHKKRRKVDSPQLAACLASYASYGWRSSKLSVEAPVIVRQTDRQTDRQSFIKACFYFSTAREKGERVCLREREREREFLCT